MSTAQAVTHRRVLRIALPIVLANVTVPLIGLADTAVVGQIGLAAPIGAVGLGAVILAAVYWIFGFLRMGTTGLAAQAFGAGDTAETGAILKRGLLIAGAAGLVLIAAQAPFLWAAFQLAPASAAVEGLTHDYLSIRIYGAPATIALYAITGWLIALERTRAVLLLQVVINLLNVGLDLWFVLGLDWGVEGVAVASLIAEYAGLGLGLWLCRAAFAGPRARVFDPVRLRRMASVNGDIMLRSVLLQASFTSFLFLAAGKGDVVLASNQILLQFLEVMAYLLDGFAFSAETLVGQAVGARRLAVLRRAVRLTGGWGLAGAAVMAVSFALIGPAVIDVMTTAPEVRAAARSYLPWIVLAPLVSIASYMLDGVFIGATRTREMLKAMVISVAVYVAVLWAFWGWGNHGLWAALMVLNATRGVTMALLYPRIPASLREVA
ncbi:MAG: multidrug resistance protein, MATE family [Rhodobacteraceae bacterium HLUCCA12]|nr:MAG: multidrug resistance protein, MATE family [Rhodobacteraceae bacterium HLUCCA12]